MSLSDIFDLLNGADPRQEVHEWLFAAVVCGAASGMGGMI